MKPSAGSIPAVSMKSRICRENVLAFRRNGFGLEPSRVAVHRALEIRLILVAVDAQRGAEIRVPECLGGGLDAGHSAQLLREGVAGLVHVEARGPARADEPSVLEALVPPAMDRGHRHRILGAADEGVAHLALGALAVGAPVNGVEQVVVLLRRAANAGQVRGQVELQLGQDRTPQREHALLAALAIDPEPPAWQVDVAPLNGSEFRAAYAEAQ